MLATPRGRSNGIAFALGWTLSLAALVTVVVLAGSGANASGGDGGPATWTLWLKLALGVLFLLMGAKQWRDRPREGAGPEAAGVDGGDRQVHAGQAGRDAAALAVANPKNLFLAVGGAVSIASSTAGGAARRSPPY